MTMMALRINMKRVWIGLISAIALAGGFSFETIAFAQLPSESFPPAASVKQLMLPLIHPSSNGTLLAISGGGRKDEKAGPAVRCSAVALAQAGASGMSQARARGEGDWMKVLEVLVGCR